MLGIKLSPRQFLDRVGQELQKIDPAQVQGLADAVWGCYQQGRFVFVIGNGGSGSNASHFCEDLGKGTLRRQDFDNDAKKRLRVISLTDNTPYILAWGNDEGFDRVFLEQLKNLANAGVADQIKGAAKETWGKVKDTANAVNENARAQADVKGESVSQRAEEKAHDLREKITTAAHNAKERIDEKLDHVKHDQQAERENTRRS